MSSPGFELSLEHQIPALINKTQMNGEHGPQCGLTSLLPMSCRGRAAAFARDLHTRLRSLGTVNQNDDAESSWLTREPAATAAPPHRAACTSPRDIGTFYDFEIECESPSSPIDEFDVPISDRSPTEDQDPPFYDFNSETEKEQAKSKLLQQEKPRTNGFTFSTAFYTDCSPVKHQPTPRENGHNEKQLFSAITFEDCTRQNGHDEVDCLIKTLPLSVVEHDRLSLPNQLNSSGDSDSEFESAKSDPSDVLDETFVSENAQELLFTESVENVSITETELPIEEEVITAETTEKQSPEPSSSENITLEIVTTEVTDEKEVSPAPEVDSTLLNAEITESKSDDNEEDDRPQRVRRCSSLKTGKTPPGTPGRKKIVRFADVLGLDLADVKTFMDEIPVIPKSAYEDLTGCDMQNSPPVRAPPRIGALTLVPLFQVPRDLTDILERLNVCLESARVGDGLHMNVCGSVRVRNLDFHKTVHIRYTMNRWKTYTDLQTTYVPGSCDGFSDRFQFVLYVPCISSGARLEIAVRFQCKGQQFWDNNSGANYCFDCLALGATHTTTTPSSGPLHPTVDWHPSFY